MSQSLRVSLTTDRLDLRPLCADDAGGLLSVFQDRAIRRYLLDDVFVSTDWLREEIAASDLRFATNGGGLWSARSVDCDSIIGFVGFRDFFEPPQLQLLYGIVTRLWGRGLATEAASAICDRAFDTLGFDSVEAAIDIPNRASARVLERLGMERVRVIDGGVGGTAFYVVTADGWQSRRDRGCA